MKTSIGERILAALIAHQLGISTDRALKVHVRTQQLHPSWEELGENLLAGRTPAAGEPRIGERLAAAVMAHLLRAAPDKVLKYCVQGQAIDPRWEELGEKLLRELGATPEQPMTHEKGWVN
jgi:hypothetical protein